MEESIFENVCKHSKQNFTEFQNFTAKRANIIGCIFSPFYLIVGIISAIYGDTYLVIPCFAFAVLFIMPAILTKKAIKLQLKRQLELYGAENEAEINFFDDRIFTTSKQSKAETNTQYDRLVKICETKHLYLLYLPSKLAILVDKNGFTKGNKEDFIAFLMSKAPKAKFKVKG